LTILFTLPFFFHVMTFSPFRSRARSPPLPHKASFKCKEPTPAGASYPDPPDISRPSPVPSWPTSFPFLKMIKMMGVLFGDDGGGGVSTHCLPPPPFFFYGTRKSLFPRAEEWGPLTGTFSELLGMGFLFQRGTLPPPLSPQVFLSKRDGLRVPWWLFSVLWGFFL